VAAAAASKTAAVKAAAAAKAQAGKKNFWTNLADSIKKPFG
jgi:hypothetical protein